MNLSLRLFINNSGIALLITLLVLVLLSAVAMNFSFLTRWGSASTRNFKEETMAYYIAQSGYQEALGYLLSDKDESVDYIDAEGNLYLDKDSKPVTGKKVTDKAEIDISITDEGAKININTVDAARLKTLFDHIQIPEDSQQEIIDSMLDWRDVDKEHHLSGAEDEYYESLDPPYKAKNGNFDAVEELLLVKGFKPEYLYGSEDIKPMYNLITTVGDGSFNVNTVSKEVLETMGLSQVEIDSLLKQRTVESGGVKQVPANLSSAGFNRFASYDFRIEVKANMIGSKQTAKITSIVRRNRSAKGFSLKSIYWREGFESRRD